MSDSATESTEGTPEVKPETPTGGGGLGTGTKGNTGSYGGGRKPEKPTSGADTGDTSKGSDTHGAG